MLFCPLNLFKYSHSFIYLWDAVLLLCNEQDDSVLGVKVEWYRKARKLSQELFGHVRQ